MNKVKLCHKCGGYLTKPNSPLLYSCRCTSSYVRGFEDNLSPSEAIGQQIEAAKKWLALYKSQKRNRLDRVVIDMRANLQRLTNGIKLEKLNELCARYILGVITYEQLVMRGKRLGFSEIDIRAKADDPDY